MVLTRSAHTATIIAFPGILATDIDPDAAALLKRAWKATERYMRPAFYGASRGSEACV
jgi:hypothetical protein